MADINHVPGLDFSAFLIPGGNGLPDLFVHASDPADWVQMQIAARNPVTSSDIPVAAEATAAAAATKMPAWLKAIEDVLMKRLGVSFGDYIRGFGVAAFVLVIALILITLGVHEFSKD